MTKCARDRDRDRPMTVSASGPVPLAHEGSHTEWRNYWPPTLTCCMQTRVAAHGGECGCQHIFPGLRVQSAAHVHHAVNFCSRRSSARLGREKKCNSRVGGWLNDDKTTIHVPQYTMYPAHVLRYTCPVVCPAPSMLQD